MTLSTRIIVTVVASVAALPAASAAQSDTAGLGGSVLQPLSSRSSRAEHDQLSCSWQLGAPSPRRAQAPRPPARELHHLTLAGAERNESREQFERLR